MRQVVLYMGMSLDGYIADGWGKVDWMTGQDPDCDAQGTYENFIKKVDTVVMGWNTYHQIVSKLSPQEWVYRGMETYVVTHREEKNKEEILFTDQEPCELVRQLKEKPGKTIWICGGAQLVQQLMSEDLIDRYHISILPIILGGGIFLFGGERARHRKMELKLVHTESQNGIVDVVYEHR